MTFKRRHWFAAAYPCVLAVVLLAPFRFESPIERNGARWSAASGIDFVGPGVIRSRSPANELTNALRKGQGFTLEVWAAGSGQRLHGPARIVSLSRESRFRNFTLGQERHDLMMLFRTTHTDLSGYRPHVRVSNVFASTARQHIVITYDFAWQTVYVNGQRLERAAVPGGDFANWDADYELLLGNEATVNAPWLGELSYVAIYDHVLSSREIEGHYAQGSRTAPATLGAVTAYDFHGGRRARIEDVSGASPPLDLWLPDYLTRGSDRFLGWPKDPYDVGERLEFAANIILFVPLGLLLYATFIQRSFSSWVSAGTVLAVGAVVTLGFESAQFFVVGRASSAVDVLANLMGAALGITVGAFRLRREARAVGQRSITAPKH